MYAFLWVSVSPDIPLRIPNRPVKLRTSVHPSKSCFAVPSFLNSMFALCLRTDLPFSSAPNAGKTLVRLAKYYPQNSSWLCQCTILALHLENQESVQKRTVLMDRYRYHS